MSIKIKFQYYTYPEETEDLSVSLNSVKTAATILEDYEEDTFNVADYGSAIKTINASAASQELTIIGNTLANRIIGSEYGDCILGGKGNDTLTGGDGQDIFVYSVGKDVITDYKAGEDNIKLESGYIKKSKISGKDIVLTIGTGTLTVKNGKGKKITVTDSEGNTPTKPYTNATYTSSTSNMIAEDIWFMDGVSEFVSENANIDSVSEITANNYSVGSIPSAINDGLTADVYQAYATDSNKE